MRIPSEKELRRWRGVNLPPKSDFLLLLVPRGPVNFGQVLFPEGLEIIPGVILSTSRRVKRCWHPRPLRKERRLFG